MASSRSPARKDVTIRVPTALGGFARGLTPETEPDPRQLLMFVLKENERLTAENASLRGDTAALRRDLRMLGDTASHISSLALCLLRMALDHGYADGPNRVRLSKKLHERMVGASIRYVTESDGSITVSLRDEGKERVVPE